MSVSTEFKQEAYSQETDVAIIALLTLSTDDGAPVRICDVPYQKLPDLGDDVYGVVSNDNTFIYLPFKIDLPRDDKTGTVSSKLTIENVTRQVIGIARSTKKPIKVHVQVVLSSNVDRVELDYDNFRLSNVVYDGFSVTGSLGLEYLGLEPFPSGRFTPDKFAGLF